MKNLLSLFDYSGTWSAPFAENDWNVIQWDIKLDEFMDINLLKDAGTVLDMFEYVDGILAAAPCTDFTAAGAQYWPKKDADGRTAQSLELVYQVQRLGNLFTPTDPDFYEENEDNGFFWALENPVGRLPKLVPSLGAATWYQPWEFAGYNNLTEDDLLRLDFIRKKNGIKVTREENDFVLACNAYTKKTGLWGDYNRNLIKKPVAPVKCSPEGSPVMRSGSGSGSSAEVARRQEARSNTPYGFALAFYEANKNHKAEILEY